MPNIAITRLIVENFRNHALLELCPGTQSVVITGANGRGKTNILEALSYLGPGRGLRKAPLSQLVRHGQSNPWRIGATLQWGDADHTLQAAYVPPIQDLDEPAPEKRLFFLNNALTTADTLSEMVHFLWLTPQMDGLFMEGSAGRRAYIDKLAALIEPGHRRRLARYEKALRERMRLLKMNLLNPLWLEGLEEVLATEGIAITAARREATERLTQCTTSPILARVMNAFPRPHLQMSGAVDARLEEEPAVVVETWLREELAQNRIQDQARGATHLGPHTSDLAVFYFQKSMPAALSSTGEQKALLIAMTLASTLLGVHAGTGQPILLLDEVVAHLDITRRALLFDALHVLGVQSWLTGTDEILFEQVPFPTHRLTL